MGILLGSGITVGNGVVLGGGSAPAPAQSRTVGTASTNTAQTYTRTGSPTTVTSPTPVLGTSSGNFSGTGRYTIQTTSPTPTMTNFGSGNWTFESWFRFTSVPSTNSAAEFFTTEVTGGLGIRFGQDYNGPINYLSVFARSGNDMNYAPYTWVANTWYFIAVQKSGTAVSMWVGVQGDSQANYIGGTAYTTSNAGNATFVNANSTGGCIVGGYNGTSVNSKTIINEICWSNIARYASTTSPIHIPTDFFTVDQYTTQLLKFQGTDGGTTFTNETS